MSRSYHGAFAAPITTPAATTLASGSALANAIAAAMRVHFADGDAHYGPDATEIYGLDAEGQPTHGLTDAGSLRTMAGAMVSTFNAHAQRSDLHKEPDRASLCHYHPRSGSNEETFALLHALRDCVNAHTSA